MCSEMCSGSCNDIDDIINVVQEGDDCWKAARLTKAKCCNLSNVVDRHSATETSPLLPTPIGRY